MEQKISLKKYLLVCAIGFGIGGLLWGWVLYRELPGLEFPFHFMAIIIMGLFGGVSLSLVFRGLKQIFKAVLAGFLGFGIGFVVGGVFVYPLSLIGVFILSIILPSSTNADLFRLEPNNIGVGGFWLIFLLIGAIIGLFYALFLKLKKWSLIWRGGIGFALGSLIGPVIGNISGNLFNSLLISYLITFSLIGIILGLFLSWGVYRNQGTRLIL